MEHFSRTNMRNIKDIFQEKTGVALEAPRRRHPVQAAAAIAAVLVCCLATAAFTFGMFSSLSGDDLALSATYQGNGIILVHVQNRSDKALHFQPQLKLMQWSANQEIQPHSENISMTGTEFQAHTSGTMTIDLSQAYDMTALEQPLTDDHYYLVLTNHDFTFGQDWHCTISFSESIQTDTPATIPPTVGDAELAAQVMEELRPYFETYPDPAQRRQNAEAYLEQCQELLSGLSDDLVAPSSPILMVEDSDLSVVFDEMIPEENQWQLVGQHRHTLDGFGLPVGASASECALVISAYVPQQQGETDGGVEIPLVYIFAYAADEIQSAQDHTFLHGQLMTFEEMEPNKVFEDSQYVCYDMTDLFYTDLRTHVDRIMSQNNDTYFDEQIWTRIQNIDAYYRDRETLSSNLRYILPAK